MLQEHDGQACTVFALGVPYLSSMSEIGARLAIRVAPDVHGLSEDGQSFLGRVFGSGDEVSVSGGEGPRMSLVSSGHLPCGHVISEDDGDRIDRALKRRGVTLIVGNARGFSKTYGFLASSLRGDVRSEFDKRVAEARLEERTPIGGYDSFDGDSSSFDVFGTLRDTARVLFLIDADRRVVGAQVLDLACQALGRCRHAGVSVGGHEGS